MLAIVISIILTYTIDVYNYHFTCMGLTEKEYVSLIENDLWTIYDPDTTLQSEELSKILEKHMNKECANLFATVNEVGDTSDTVVEINSVDIIYGEFQRDGTNKVIASLTVTNKTTRWDIHLVMKIGINGMIYEVEVY